MNKRFIAPVVATVGVFLLAGCSTTDATTSSYPNTDSNGNTVTEPIVIESPATLKKAKVNTVTPTITTSGDYGVGATIDVDLSAEVPRKLRQSVQNNIWITAPTGLPAGAWVWRDNDTMTFRTETYLPTRTTITITTTPKTTLGVTKAGVWKMGKKDTATMNIKRDLRTNISGKTKKAVVTIDGKKARTMPVSLGKKGWETRSGIKTTTDKHRIQRMTSGEIGAEEFYDLQVPYAVRITSSGEFIHAAPWATGRLGNANGSHGCTNLSMSDGRWFYNHTLPGDPVITTGTSKKMETWNGPGGVWNHSWKQWLAQSTGDVVPATTPAAAPVVPDVPAPVTLPAEPSPTTPND